MNYTELIDKDRKFIKRIIIAVIIIVSISFSLVFIMAFIIPYNNGDDVSFLGCTINRNKQEDNKTKLSTDSTKFYKNDGKEQNKQIESTEKRYHEEKPILQKNKIANEDTNTNQKKGENTVNDKKEEKPTISIVNSKNVNTGINNGFVGEINNINVTETPKRELNRELEADLINEINQYVKEKKKDKDFLIMVSCLHNGDPEPFEFSKEICSFLKTKYKDVGLGSTQISGNISFKGISIGGQFKDVPNVVEIVVGFR